jgi:hypothetical protein
MLMQPTEAAVRKGQGQLKFGGGVSNSAHGTVPRFANHQRQISAANAATNRESDKIIVLLPAGMRKHLAEMAARRGKSMNAEVVTALAIYIMHNGEPDQRTIKSELAEMKQELKFLRDTLDRNRGREPLEDLAAEVGRAWKEWTWTTSAQPSKWLLSARRKKTRRRDLTPRAHASS